MRKATTLATLIALTGAFALAGCGEKTAGEKLDDAIEDTTDAAEDMADDAGDAAEDAGEAIDEALEKK